MKKNGWGLRAELGFILIFVICILISTIGLYKMGLFGGGEDGYIDSDEYIGTFDYDALEQRVSSSAKRYYNDIYPNGNHETVIVSVNTLTSNGYMNEIRDSRNKKCDGYAKILENGNVVSYIKCSIYKTTGYSEEYE